MADNDEAIRLVLDVAGQETIEGLRKSTENYRSLLESTVASFARGEVTADEFTASQKKLGAEYDRQRQLLVALEAAQQAAGGAVTNTTSALAAQSGSASAWGAVMASAADSSKKAAQAIADKAAADKQAVSVANQLHPITVLTTQAVESDSRAAEANAVAKRQAANATAGVARQEEFLSQVIRAGVGDMVAESAALNAVGKGAEVTASDLASLRAQTAQLVAESKSLAAAFISGRINADQFQAGLQRINATTNTLRSAEAALSGASSKMAGLGQAGLQTGRVMQDFAQGGIGGIINNIEGLSMALGMGAGVAGALTLLGVAALIATPHVKEWYRSLTGESNEIPKAADALGRVNDSLKEVTKKLDDYKEKQHLTNKELVDYNKLSREQINLEREKNAEAERKRDIDAVNAIAPKERTERGAGFKEAVAGAGGGEAITGQLESAILALFPEMETAEAFKKAEDLMSEGAKGFKDSIKEIQDTLRRGGQAGGQKVADEIDATSPETKEKAKVADKIQRLRDILADADNTEAEVNAGMAEVAGMTDKQLDKVIERTQRQIKVRKDQEKKEDAANKAAEAATNFEVEHEAKLAEFLKKQDDKAAKADEKAGAKDAKGQTAAAKRDLHDLAEGLGDDLLAELAARRIALYLDPETNQKDMAAFRVMLRKRAQAALEGAGHSPEEAARLAGGAGGLVDSDAVQRANQAKAVAGAPGASMPDAMRAAFGNLMGQLGNRPRPAARAAPAPVLALKRRGKVGAAAAAPRPTISLTDKAIAARAKAFDKANPQAKPKTPAPVGSAQAEADAKQQERRQRARAAPVGPSPARRMGQQDQAAAGAVQGGQAGLQGAMSAGQQATAQVVRNQAVLDQRTRALETGFMQLTRAAERVGRTNQSMGT